MSNGQNQDYGGRFRGLPQSKINEFYVADKPFGVAVAFQVVKNNVSSNGKKAVEKAKKDGLLVAEPPNIGRSKLINLPWFTAGGYEGHQVSIRGTWIPISTADKSLSLRGIYGWGGNVAETVDYIRTNIGRKMRIAFVRNDNWAFIFEHRPETDTLEVVDVMPANDLQYTQKLNKAGLDLFLVDSLEEYENAFQRDNPLTAPKPPTPPTAGGGSGNASNTGAGANSDLGGQLSDFISKNGIILGATLGGALLLIILLKNK